MIHTSIQSLMPQVIALFKKHRIKNAYLFGSALNENFNESSDVDILVNMEEGLDPIEAGGHLWDLEDDLQLVFNRPIDLLTERSLKNPYFIKQISSNRILIYGI